MTDPSAAVTVDPGAAERSAPGGPAWTMVPEWLSNLAAVGWRVFVVAVLGVVVIAICGVLWTTTASIVVAAVVSAVFAPVVLRLRAQGRSRNAAAGIVWATALLIIGGLLVVLALALVPRAADLVAAITSGVQAVKTALADLGLPPAVTTALQAAVDEVKSSVGSASGGIVAQAAEAVTIAIISTFLLFFFLRDGDRAWVWVFQNVGDHKREVITQAGDVALRRVGGYLRGTTVLAAIMAVTALAFMLILDVPLALPLAFFVFLGTFIPYFGGIVATAAILVVAYAAHGFGTVVVLLLLFGVRNLVVGYGVRPALYGRTVRLHPAVVLLALPAGYELAGVVGLFAAVPIIAVVMTVWSSVVMLLEPERAPELPALVPPALDRAAQVSWRLLVALGILALVAFVSVSLPLVVVPVIGGLIGAATLVPLLHALERRGMTRGRAAAVSVGGTALAVVGVLVLAAASLVDQVPDIAATAQAGASSASTTMGGQLDLPALAVVQGATELVRAVVAVGTALGHAAVMILLGTLLAFYLLRDGPELWGRVLARTPRTRRGDIEGAGTRAVSVLGGYMIGTAAISFVGAASQFVIMVVLGLPLALPVFVLSFILCFIPYIGGFISTGIAFLIAIAVGTPAAVVVMLIWTVVFNIVQGNVVSPLVYGKTVHLHPAIVLVAIPAAASVAGILGMFIVVPALGMIAVSWRSVLAILAARSAGEGASGPIDADSRLVVGPGAVAPSG